MKSGLKPQPVSFSIAGIEFRLEHTGIAKVPRDIFRSFRCQGIQSEFVHSSPSKPLFFPVYEYPAPNAAGILLFAFVRNAASSADCLGLLICAPSIVGGGDCGSEWRSLGLQLANELLFHNIDLMRT